MENQNRRRFIQKGGLILATGAMAGVNGIAIGGPTHDGMHDAVKSKM